MRIDEIKKDFKKYYQIIQQKPNVRDRTGSKKEIVNILPYMEIVRTLAECYEDAFPSIRKMKQQYDTLFLWSQNNIVADIQEINNYISLFEQLKRELEQNIHLLEIVSPTFASGYYLKIKLPECTNAAQLAQFFTDINFILEQIDKYFGAAAGDFELYDFQHGSKWADFKLNTPVICVALLGFIGHANAVYDFIENVSNTIQAVSQFAIKSSEDTTRELEQEKANIIRTQTETFIETTYKEKFDEKTLNEVKTITTKVVEKTIIILESGGTFQVEIVENLDAVDENGTTVIDENTLEKLEAVNKKQLEISNSLKYVPAYPQLSLPESQRTIETTETNNN